MRIIDKTKTLAIGLFIIAACASVVWLLLFMHPSVGDMSETLHIQFASVDKVERGTRVTFAGKPVGEVIAIQTLHNARKEQTDTDGRVYYYDVIVGLDSSISVFSTDEILLQTAGLMGERNIAILPRPFPSGVTPVNVIQAHQPMYGRSNDPMQETFIQFNSLAEKIGDMVSNFNRLLKANSDDISITVQSLQRASNHLEVLTAKGADILTYIADGKGAVGRFIYEDTLYLQMESSLDKVSTLMNDINHYGLLFHLNKGWQRERTQRMNLLNQITSPTAFQDYFATEIDRISTSLERVSVMLNKVETNIDNNESLKHDKPLVDAFGDLLRRVDVLDDTLRAYNDRLFLPSSNDN